MYYISVVSGNRQRQQMQKEWDYIQSNNSNLNMM